MNLIRKLLLLTFLWSLLAGCGQGTKPEQAISLTIDLLLDDVPTSEQVDKIAQSQEVIQARLDEMSIWPTEFLPGSESPSQLSLLFFSKPDLPMEFVREVVQQRGSLWITSTYSGDQIVSLFPDSLLSHVYHSPSDFPSTSPLIGMVLTDDTMEVRTWLNEAERLGLFPGEFAPAFSRETTLYKGRGWVELLALRKEPGNIELNSRSLVEVVPEKDQRGQWVISMSMNEKTAKAWEKMTTAHVDRHLAFVLDGKVVSYPVVICTISGGRTHLCGNFTEAEAKRLAILLRHESLPLAVRIVGEEVVSLKE